jgi:hypothetical protein
MPTACLPLRRLLPWLLLCTLAAPGPGALAQVLRCTDPVTGKVSYTDGRCDSGSQALEIEPRKSPEQLQAERTQAAEALAREQDRREADEARRTREALLERERLRSERQAEMERERERAWERERQRLQALENPYPPPTLWYPPPPPRPHPPRPPHPGGAGTQAPITHCNVFRCYDAQGGQHPR